MKTLLPASLLLLVSTFSLCQSVTNTSYVNQSGEKVLRFEIRLPISVDKAWEFCSTDDGLKKWIAPSAHIELKTGGYIVTNYDKTLSLDDSTSIRLPIVHFLEKELLALKVNLNDHFPASARKTDNRLVEIIQIKRVDESHTDIISTMVGFGEGLDWETTYQFFQRGNAWTSEQMLKAFR